MGKSGGTKAPNCWVDKTEGLGVETEGGGTEGEWEKEEEETGARW